LVLDLPALARVRRGAAARGRIGRRRPLSVRLPGGGRLARIAWSTWHMIQPDELRNAEPLKWSPGIGTDVWDLLRAAVAGDIEEITRLVAKDPSLVRSHHAYRTPLYF